MTSSRPDIETPFFRNKCKLRTAGQNLRKYLNQFKHLREKAACIYTAEREVFAEVVGDKVFFSYGK